MWIILWGQPVGATPFLSQAELVVADQAVAFPFGNLRPENPVHPAVAVGAGHSWVDGGLDLVQSAHLAGFLHPTIGNALRLSSDLEVRAALPAGPFVELGLTAGVQHVMRQRDVLVWDEATDSYGARASRGYPTFVGGFVCAAGVDLDRALDVPVALALDYRWLGQTAFLPALPVGPQGALGVSLRVAPGRSS